MSMLRVQSLAMMSLLCHRWARAVDEWDEGDAGQARPNCSSS